MEGAVSPPSPPSSSPPSSPSSSSEEEQFLHVSARDVLDPDEQQASAEDTGRREEKEQEGSKSVECAGGEEEWRDPSDKVVQPTDDRGVELEDDDDDDDDTGMPPLEDTKLLASGREAPPSYEDGDGKSGDSGQVPGPRPDPAGNTDSTAATAALDQCMDVLGNGLLKKKVIREGQGDESRPQRRQEVTMRVKSMLGDGTVVDEQEALRFTIGDGDVIQALDLCAELMALGEVAEITTDAKYAYGALGSLGVPAVPGGATLVMEAELVAVSDALDAASLPVDDRAALAHRKRERGNHYFQRGDYTHAIASYDRAIKIADTESSVASSEDEDRSPLLDVKLKCLNNVAAAQLRLDQRDAALRSCEAALALQPDSVKALFRKGKVLALQGEFSQAADTLRRALKLEPSNKTIQAELHKLRRQRSEQQAEEKTLYKKMLGNMAAPADEAERGKPGTWGLPWKWVFGAATIALGSIIVSIIVAARS
ncbi:peptidyl-prolyl cis-trans isomerase FKBP8 [Lampetra planeri]